MNWGAPVAEAQAEALSCSFLTHAYITHTCRGEAEMCFDTDDGRWEVYNESRAAQPQCYLFHYLNNGPGTARWMLLLDTNVTFQTLYFSGIKSNILLLCTGIFFGPVSLRNKWQAWGVGWWICAREYGQGPSLGLLTIWLNNYWQNEKSQMPDTSTTCMVRNYVVFNRKSHHSVFLLHWKLWSWIQLGYYPSAHNTTIFISTLRTFYSSDKQLGHQKLRENSAGLPTK